MRGNGPAGSRVRRGADGRGRLIRTDGAQWSDEAEERFFDLLAASCNVKASVEAVGFTVYTVYRLRRLRPDFALRWRAALEQGHARLEMALFRAANDTLEGVKFDAEQPIPSMTAAEALRLVQLYGPMLRGEGPEPGRRPRRRSLDEVRGSIMKKVAAIRRMIDASGRAVDLEVDGGIDAATAARAVQAGADALVAGTSVFGGGDYRANIARLRPA